MKRLISYIKDSFDEVINHVTWPTFNNLSESTVLVIVGSIVFGLVIFAIDLGFINLAEFIYK